MDTKHPDLVQDNTPASKSDKQLSSYFASFVKPTCSSRKKRKFSDEDVAVDAYLMIARGGGGGGGGGGSGTKCRTSPKNTVSTWY